MHFILVPTCLTVWFYYISEVPQNVLLNPQIQNYFPQSTGMRYDYLLFIKKYYVMFGHPDFEDQDNMLYYKIFC
jgi:hypothetical protein